MFTDRGELVWDDGKYFHFIDPATLAARIVPQCRKTDHPRLPEFGAEGKTHAQA